MCLASDVTCKGLEWSRLSPGAHGRRTEGCAEVAPYRKWSREQNAGLFAGIRFIRVLGGPHPEGSCVEECGRGEPDLNPAHRERQQGVGGDFSCWLWSQALSSKLENILFQLHCLEQSGSNSTGKTLQRATGRT